jgi:hypothetical protein
VRVAGSVVLCCTVMAEHGHEQTSGGAVIQTGTRTGARRKQRESGAAGISEKRNNMENRAEECSCSVGSLAAPATPSGRGMFEGG